MHRPLPVGVPTLGPTSVRPAEAFLSKGFVAFSSMSTRSTKAFAITGQESRRSLSRRPLNPGDKCTHALPLCRVRELDAFGVEE